LRPANKVLKYYHGDKFTWRKKQINWEGVKGTD